MLIDEQFVESQRDDVQGDAEEEEVGQFDGPEDERLGRCRADTLPERLGGQAHGEDGRVQDERGASEGDPRHGQDDDVAAALDDP